jgi:hypothetical protein
MPLYVDTILCEIIRSETNNKLSLFGLFGAGLFVPNVPAVIPSLAFLQRWSPTDNEPAGTRVVFSLRLRGPGGVDLIILGPTEVVVPPPPRPLIQVAVQLQGFPVPAEGDYELATIINDEVRNRYTFFAAVPTREQRAHLQGFPNV